MTRAPLDLAYTHEMAACAFHATVAPRQVRGGAAARDLTARLRCLKALIDDERRGGHGASAGRRKH